MKHSALKMILQLGIPAIMPALKKRRARKEEEEENIQLTTVLNSITFDLAEKMQNATAKADEPIREAIPNPGRTEPKQLDLFDDAEPNKSSYRTSPKTTTKVDSLDSVRGMALRAQAKHQTNSKRGEDRERKRYDTNKINREQRNTIISRYLRHRVEPIARGLKPMPERLLASLLNKELGLDKSVASYRRIYLADDC